MVLLKEITRLLNSPHRVLDVRKEWLDPKLSIKVLFPHTTEIGHLTFEKGKAGKPWKAIPFKLCERHSQVRHGICRDSCGNSLGTVPI